MIEITNYLDKIKEIFYKIFKFEIKTTIYSKIAIYKKDDNIIGFCIFDLIYDRCEIEYIAVDLEYINQKIASELIDYVIFECKKNNCCNISLEVNINNVSAIKLYEKFNFKIEALRKNYFNNDDAYLMVRVV